MTEILVIRHGETDWNAEGRYQGHSDNDLNQEGERQARAVATRLARNSETFGGIISSDLTRALHTAQIIKKQTGLEIITDERLRERKVGVFRGLTQHEARITFPNEFASFKTDQSYVVPEGESKEALQMRANRFLDWIAATGDGRRFIVVTHGGIIDSFVRRVFLVSLSIHLPFSNFNAAINRFTYRADHWIAATLGDISHLEEPKKRHPVREEKLLD